MSSKTDVDILRAYISSQLIFWRRQARKDAKKENEVII